MKRTSVTELLNRSSATVVDAGDKRESLIEFIWEMVSCWLLTLGTSLLQNVQLPYPLDTVTVLWQTALAVVLLALFSRRWFLMLIVTVQALLLGLLAMLLFQLPIGESLANAVDFCGWFFGGMPYDEMWSTGSGMAVLHTILNFGISLLMFFVVRVSRGAWPPLILCFSLLIVIMMFGNSENNAAAVALYLAGCLPMIARDRYNGRQLFSGEEKFRAMGTRWGVSTAAGILCLILAGTLLLSVPIDTRNLRTRWCSDVTADFQSLTGWYTSEQRKTDTCTLDTLGLQAYPDRLGGNITMPDSNLLAVTDATEGMLMRVTAFDTFTGENWKHDFSTAYRLGGLFDGKQAYLTYNRIAGDTTWRGTLMTLCKTETVAVTVQQDTYLLPTLSQMAGYTENTPTNNPAQFNNNGEIISFFGFAKGYQYTLQQLQLPISTMNTKEKTVLNTLTTVGRDAFYDNERNLAPYLAVPDTISDQAATVAASLFDEEDTLLENAITIMNYFTPANGFRYSEAPGPVRGQENVVDKVLTDKVGYSVYYASAMAMMTRSVGIPTRLAAGYRTVQDANGQYVVDAAHPCAWVECYFRNLGWITFDPTPSSTTVQKPVATPQTNKEEKPIDESSDEPEYLPKEPSRLPLIILLILVILAAVIWVLRTVFINKLYALPVLRRILRSNTAVAAVYYADILRQVGRLTAPHRAHQTALEFLQNPALGDELTAALTQAVAPMMAYRYGEEPLTAADAEQLAQLHATLEVAVHDKLRVERYWLWRRLLRPLLTPAVCRILYRERKQHYDKPSVTD